MTMASSTLLGDLEENFFKCAVCLDQFKEPKQLPCLHRYCSDCLKTVIQTSDDGAVKCPLCKQKCVISEDGVDGFKTDFYMKSMLEFVQLQKSFENKDLITCVGCSNTKVSSYCFKCKQLLCNQCYQYHVTNTLFTGHQQHTMKLDNIEAKNLTLEKLATFSKLATKHPMCHNHVEDKAQLCCSSCGNVPICVACPFSMHKDHVVHAVSDVAKSERELLKSKFSDLSIHKNKLYELLTNITITRQKLKENVAKKTETLTMQYNKQVTKIANKRVERTTVRESGLTDIEKRRTDENIQNRLHFEEELRQLKDKYDTITKTIKGTYDYQSEEFTNRCDEIEDELSRIFENLDDNLKNLTAAKELLTKQNENELKEISDYHEQIIKRYENFTATTSSSLAFKDDWTDAQCIPDIRAASEPLMEEMAQECPELESLSDFSIGDITNISVDNITITEREESVVDIKGIKAKDWTINAMTSSIDGNIVVTGKVSDKYSHITVINIKGEIQRQDQIKRERNYIPRRFCCSTSTFKVVTVCTPDEIGLYHVRDGSYKKKKISDVINNWPAHRCVFCVAVDPVNNHIIVGTNSRYVYVFDDQLNYSHIITLPDVINESYDIAVHGSSFLICDHCGTKACVVKIEGSESKLMYEFAKPHFDEGDCMPISVCTEKNGFIYMLWCAFITGQWRGILVRYSQDGRHLLTKRTVDSESRYVTTLKVDGSEKLLLATEDTGKLYTFGLVQ